MKKLITLLTAATLIFSLTSCDELNDLLKVTFEDVEVEETMDVPTGAALGVRSIALVSEDNAGSYTFSDSVVFLNLDGVEGAEGQEENLADYLDDITDLKLTMLKFTVLGLYNMVELPVFEIPSLTVSITHEDSIIYTETFIDVRPDVAITVNTFSPEVTKGISECISAKKELIFKAEGTMNSEGKIDAFNLMTKAIADIQAGLGTTLTGADS